MNASTADTYTSDRYSPGESADQTADCLHRVSVLNQDNTLTCKACGQKVKGVQGKSILPRP